MFYRLSVDLGEHTEEIGEFRTNKRQAMIYSRQLLKTAPVGKVRIERKRSFDAEYKPWIERSYNKPITN